MDEIRKSESEAYPADARETNKLAAPLIKQEEASKYRCKECQKLFRAPEFVIKHITVKHPDMVEVKTEEVGAAQGDANCRSPCSTHSSSIHNASNPLPKHPQQSTTASCPRLNPISPRMAT